VAAFGTAISQLIASAAMPRPSHPCDVRFGREVVAVLEAAEAARRSPSTNSGPDCWP